MAIENINFSTKILYKAMKYNGVNTVGDLLEKERSKKDLLTILEHIHNNLVVLEKYLK